MNTLALIEHIRPTLRWIPNSGPMLTGRNGGWRAFHPDTGCYVWVPTVGEAVKRLAHAIGVQGYAETTEKANG